MLRRYSFDYDPPETSYHVAKYYPEYVLYSHWRIVLWDLATTQAGSSGCPLFNQDKQLVGLLTGGEATCQSSVNDYFTKLITPGIIMTNRQKNLLVLVGSIK